MSNLRTAAQQALEALEWHLERGAWGADIEGVTVALCAALAEPVQESVATTQQPVIEKPPSDYRRGYWDGFAIGKREGRIEAEDAALKAQEQAEPVAGIIEPRIEEDSHQTLDEAMRLPRAMAQAYENGYKAGQAHERERCLRLIDEHVRAVDAEDLVRAIKEGM